MNGLIRICNRNKVALSCLVFVGLMIVQVLSPQSTYAMFGRSAYTGYFTGSYATSGDYLQPGGIGVTNIDSFVSWYKAKLSGSQHERIMASFTIRTMMGQDVGSAGQRDNVPSSTLNDWEERVRAYDAAGRVNFNRSYSFNKNTFYQASGDVAWYNDSDTQPSIVFTAPGGATYAIKRSCANPVGDIAPLPDLKWSLEAPRTQLQLKSGGWTGNNITRKPGETVTSRYRVANATRVDAGPFQRWREMNFQSNGTIITSGSWRAGSKGTTDSLGGNDTYTSGTTTFTIPSNAPDGRQYCWRAKVDPRSSTNSSVLTGNQACVTVQKSGCPPSDPYFPDCAPPDQPPPTWALSLSSSVNVAWVEQGQIATWAHYITNTDPNGQGGKVADGLQRCAVFNYIPSSPNSGTLPYWSCGALIGASIPFGGPHLYQDDAPILYTDGNTPLGGTFCQYYAVSQQAEYTPGVGGNSTPPACVVVVGGKTYVTPAPPSSSTIEPGETIDFGVSVLTSQYQGAAGYGGYGINCTYDVVALDGAGNVARSLLGNTGCGGTISSTAPINVSHSQSTSEATAPVGSRVCLRITSFGPSNGNTNLLQYPGSPIPQPVCVDVVARPYFKVSNSDISAGSKLGCVAAARISSWNKGGTGDLGAGAQFAAFASGVLTGFTGAQGLATGAGYPERPTGLNFANTTGLVNVANSTFGGSFTGACSNKNFYGQPPASALAWTDLASAVQTPSAERVFIASTASQRRWDAGSVIVANGNSTTVYVDGDLYIGSNIGAAAGATTQTEIPLLTVIARGNIYIGKDVTNLYGTFIAQPSGPNTGNIYTCSRSNFTKYNPSASPGDYAECRTRLTVVGSFMAQKVHLLRTYGSQYQAIDGATSGQWAAEEFRYNPLIWARQFTVPTEDSGFTPDSVTNLPPIL